MARDGRWVLIADGSRRVADQGRAAVAAVRALGVEGYRTAVTATSDLSLAAASRYCDRRVPVPSITMADGYLAAVHAELSQRDYLTCLPASDAALLTLGGPGASLLDKLELGRRASEAGLEVPESRVFGSRDAMVVTATEHEYPIVVKPSTHRQKPVRVESADHLSIAPVGDGSFVVQPWLDDPITSVAGLMWKRELVASVHAVWLRKWRLDCGNAAAAETISPDRDLEAKLTRLLRDYEGVFNAQFIGPYLLDVHPRVYGTHSLAVAAGVNLIAMHCGLLRGNSIDPRAAKHGVLYRWTEGDVRHVFTSVRRHRLSMAEGLKALAPRPGTAHGVESLIDPGPAIARLRYGLRHKLTRSWWR